MITFARMLMIDEAAIICDFAEYYNIYDYRAIPAYTAAILACGLPIDSRIMKRVFDQKVDLKTILLAGIMDRLSTLVWFQTKDGHKHRNRPESFVKILTDKTEKKKEKTFKSGKEFEQTRKKLLKGVNR